MKKSVEANSQTVNENSLNKLQTIGQLALTPIACVSPATSAADVAQMFVDLRVPSIAVVDDNQDVCGLITRTDVLRCIPALTATADDLMSCYVFALSEDSSIACAAALMATEDVGQVVVLDKQNNVIGVLTSLDIARHVAARAGYLAA